jgi:aminoglycoside phosphotransferase (APT) family kinase protein
VLDNELVLSLARRHAPHVRAVTGVDESGGEARTYALDADIILKTQRPQRLRPRTSLEKEVFFLIQIAKDAPDLSVPRVLGYGREGRYIEYTVMTRMPGVALRHAQLTTAQRQAVMFELGRALHRIHQLPQEPFATHPLMSGDRNAVAVRARCAALMDELTEQIRERHRAWSLPLSPEALSQRALAALPEGDERVALHSNPYHEHTFVDPTTGTYTGLIDFGDAYISHPTFDLRRWRTREERAALMEGYTHEQPVSAAFMQMWRVAQIIGNLAAIAGSAELGPLAHDDLPRLLAEL